MRANNNIPFSAEQVKNLLYEKRMTQVELAKYLDINKDYLQQVLKNGKINGQMLARMARVLDCEPESLVIGKVISATRWKLISPAGIYECSECGQNVMTNDISAYRFCHGCGAEMGVIKELKGRRE